MAFRGVNLGGWLVLERWITPAVFEGTSAADEYSLGIELNAEEAEARLSEHREHFITRDHVKKLARMGLTVLRLPVGYWLFDAEKPFISGGDRYVDLLFKWAQEFGLQIILDIHAAPGSQNGWDHSGRAGEVAWPRDTNIKATLSFLKQVVDRYGRNEQLLGVEVLNEPHWDIPLDTLMRYYHQSYEIIDEGCAPDAKAIFSDSFRPDQIAKELSSESLERAVLDMHLYQLFTPEDKSLNLDQHLKKASEEWTVLLTRVAKRGLPIMVGEWSAAMNEQYNATGEKQLYNGRDYAKYFHTQLATFDNLAIGWAYWTARVQGGGPWSLLDHHEFLKD